MVRCPLVQFPWQYTHTIFYHLWTVIYLYIGLPYKLMNNLKYETISYSCLSPKAHCRIHHEGVTHFGCWTNQQDCNILSFYSQSPISGSMNEDRNSWGHVDQQKLTDFLFCPSPSWPYSPCRLQVQHDRHLCMFQALSLGSWLEWMFVWSKGRADWGGSWVTWVPTSLASLCHLWPQRLGQGGCSRVRLSST